MKCIVHTGPLRVSAGVEIRLSDEQLRRRAHLVSKTGKGVYTGNAALIFKTGEEIDFVKKIDDLDGYIRARVETRKAREARLADEEAATKAAAEKEAAEKQKAEQEAAAKAAAEKEAAEKQKAEQEAAAKASVARAKAEQEATADIADPALRGLLQQG